MRARSLTGFLLAALIASSAEGRDVVIGDSLSAVDARRTAWPRLIFDDYVDLATPGNTLYATLSNTSWLAKIDPGDHVYILLGTNDLAIGLTPAHAASLMRALIDRVESAGATRVLILKTPRVYPPQTNQFDVWYLGELLDPLCPCVDLRGFPPEFYIYDGLHLNQDGQDEIARRVPEAEGGLIALALLGWLRRWKHGARRDRGTPIDRCASRSV